MIVNRLQVSGKATAIVVLCLSYALAPLLIEGAAGVTRQTIAPQLLAIAFASDPVLEERLWERPALSLDLLTPLKRHSLEMVMGEWKWKGNFQEIANAVLRASSYFKQDPWLMLSIIKVESGGRSSAHSYANARGLMQLLPGTGRYIAKNKKVHWRGTRALYHESYNIVLGVGYFDYLMDKVHGDQRLALAAYNWGPGNLENIDNDYSRVPREVKSYVSRVMRVYEELKK